MRRLEVEGPYRRPRTVCGNRDVEALPVAPREVKGDGVGGREIKVVLAARVASPDAVRVIPGDAEAEQTQQRVEEVCVGHRLILRTKEDRWLRGNCVERELE